MTYGHYRVTLGLIGLLVCRRVDDPIGTDNEKGHREMHKRQLSQFARQAPGDQEEAGGLE